MSVSAIYLRDTGTICHDIQITEPQDTKSLRFQERITALIPNKAGGLVVLATVDLDDELRGVTDEIRDIGADRHLPAEQCVVQTVGADDAPDDPLRLGRILAQIAGACVL